MNKVMLVGRLTNDVKVEKTQNGKSVCRFSVACDRKGKAEEGKQNADFPRCIVYGNVADFMGKYCNKGDLVEVIGRWQTGSYEKDGVTVFTNECFVEEFNLKLSYKKQEKTQSVDEVYSGM